MAQDIIDIVRVVRGDPEQFARWAEKNGGVEDPSKPGGEGIWYRSSSRTWQAFTTTRDPDALGDLHLDLPHLKIVTSRTDMTSEEFVGTWILEGGQITPSPSRTIPIDLSCASDLELLALEVANRAQADAVQWDARGYDLVAVADPGDRILITLEEEGWRPPAPGCTHYRGPATRPYSLGLAEMLAAIEEVRMWQTAPTP